MWKYRKVAARRVPLVVAACAARRAAQFRLRQCNAMQVRSPSRQDRDYEYIPVTRNCTGNIDYANRKLAKENLIMEISPYETDPLKPVLI